jgi:Beta-propeller repeat
MRYSTSTVRRLCILALALIGLLQTPIGPAPARREPVLPAWVHDTTRLNHERLFSHRPPPHVDQKTRARVSEAYGSLPIRFEENVGQTGAEVKFLARGGGYNLFLTQSEAVLVLPRLRSRSDADAQSLVRLKLIEADPAPQMEGLNQLPGRSNYLIGRDASRWRWNVASFAKVRYRSVYPGIDLIYYGNQRQLEYDFVVAPGADPQMIRLGFDGVDQIQIDGQGDLVLQTANGEVRQRKPLAYQEADGVRREIASRYVLKDEQEVSFELGQYDRAQPLVIDPVIAYSTYLGGSFSDYANSFAVDAAGNAYVTGLTFSSDFPTSNPLQPNPGGNNDAGDVFVAKLHPEGSALVYSTYLGGSGYDEALAMAVDEDGNAYLTGRTASTDFPMMNPLQPGLSGGPFDPEDFFVTKLSADGSALIYSTYLGGAGPDVARALAIDKNGNVYVAGETASSDFPTMNPLQPTYAGILDVAVAKLKADGSALVYSTYLGGGNAERLYGIAVDRFGGAYLTGWTFSNDFPTANPLKPALADGDLDAFVTKIDAEGSALVYSTYLGGGRQDRGRAIAIDAFGNVYVTGITQSTDFPTANPLQPVLAGLEDAFVTKLNRNGSALLYSTYHGGADTDWGLDIAVDSLNRVYVSGWTRSDDFPTLDAAQPIPDSMDTPDNGFATNLKADGSALIYSTYLGGRGYDEGGSITVDARGNAYVFGRTDSDDLPTTPGAVQRGYRDPSGDLYFDAFITKISAPCRHHDHDKDCEGRHSRKALH